MENRLTNSVAELNDRLFRAIAGAERNAAALGLPADIVERLNAAVTELIAKDNAYEAGKAELSAARRVHEAVIDRCRGHATVVRDLYKRKFGPRYCQAWDILGFRGSIMIPRTTGDLLHVLSLMVGDLTAHPEMGSADLGITAVRTQELYDELSVVRSAVDEKNATRQRLFKERSNHVVKVRKLLRSVLDDLKFALDPMDPRWIEFGFNRPGAKATPEVPEEVTVVVQGDRAAAIMWEDSPRAEYYHVWMRAVGVDEEFVRVATSADAGTLLENLPGKAKVEIGVSAVNSGGESRMSEIVVLETRGDGAEKIEDRQ